MNLFDVFCLLTVRQYLPGKQYVGYYNILVNREKSVIVHSSNRQNCICFLSNNFQSVHLRSNNEYHEFINIFWGNEGGVGGGYKCPLYLYC